MKMTYNDYQVIFSKTEKQFIKSLMNYSIVFSDANNSATVYVEIPVWLYLILFIPAHLLEVISLVWNGGLKNFEICPRNIATYKLHYDEPRYEKAKKIFKNA